MLLFRITGEKEVHGRLITNTPSYEENLKSSPKITSFFKQVLL